MKIKNKLNKRLFSFALCLVIGVFSTVTVFADGIGTSIKESEEMPYKSYTYWSNYNADEKTAAYSKPMYRIDSVKLCSELNIPIEAKLSDMAADKNGNIYIIDSELSRIYILDNGLNMKTVITSVVADGKKTEFKGAMGIYVDKNGLIYISDTENGRVLACDIDGNLKKQYLLPDSRLIPTDFKFRPIKTAIDSKGYTYILSDGSYYGAILYSPEMEFLGFFGANSVKNSITDVLKQLWKRLTSNDTKRAADKVVIPYSFTDIAVGNENFIYTATGKSGSSKIQQGQIKLYNPGGKEIMQKDSFNFADTKFGRFEHAYSTQDLSYLDVDTDGFFYALDVTLGRIYWYSADCSLLSVFGGNTGEGTQRGTFSRPVAIAVSESRVYICDGDNGSITSFAMTEYGGLVREAQKITLSGNYTQAKRAWEKIISLDANSQLGYKGLAKAYYDNGEYSRSMLYAKHGMDRETYAKAFKAERTKLFEKNFALIFVFVVLFIALITALIFINRRKRLVLIKNPYLNTALLAIAHPAEGFRLVKEKNLGSVLISTVIIILYYVLTVLSDTKEGFAFSSFNSESYNALYVFFSTVGLVLLWTASNWLVSTLAGGIGKITEIYTVTGYCLIPLIFGLAIKLILTNVLVPDEAAFLGILTVCCMLYSLLMLIIGIMRIHDFSFSRFCATAVFAVIGILVIIFLIMLMFLLSQQLFGWLGTIFVELRYR